MNIFQIKVFDLLLHDFLDLFFSHDLFAKEVQLALYIFSDGGRHFNYIFSADGCLLEEVELFGLQFQLSFEFLDPVVEFRLSGS